MSDLTSGASTQDLIALAVAGVIFLITIVLVARQAVNFLITIILLFFALVSGFAIANNNIIREKFETPETQKALDEAIKAPAEQPDASALEQLRIRLLRIFEQLVELLSNKSSSGSAVNAEQQAKMKELIQDIETKMSNLQILLDGKEVASTGS